MLSLPKARVQSLVGEQRSHNLHRVALNQAWSSAKSRFSATAQVTCPWSWPSWTHQKAEELMNSSIELSEAVQQNCTLLHQPQEPVWLVSVHTDIFIKWSVFKLIFLTKGTTSTLLVAKNGWALGPSPPRLYYMCRKSKESFYWHHTHWKKTISSHTLFFYQLFGPLSNINKTLGK